MRAYIDCFGTDGPRDDMNPESGLNFARAYKLQGVSYKRKYLHPTGRSTSMLILLSRSKDILFNNN
jgi:hypothetical protein